MGARRDDRGLGTVDPAGGREVVLSFTDQKPFIVTAAQFVSEYADANLCVADAPTGKCNGCEHYRLASRYSCEDVEDWCWLKEGKYADGRENECPAWESYIH